MESKSIHSENESVSDSACAPLLQCMRTTAAVHVHHCCSACVPLLQCMRTTAAVHVMIIII